MESRIGAELAAKMRDVAIQLYTEASNTLPPRGIIIADTKFEFGLDENGVMHLMDEVLTADSSRFWPADSYATASRRRRSTSSSCATTWKPDWGKTAPAQALPADVIEKPRPSTSKPSNA
jgi:phosphoribosylaminoimidazole-succinocarboxamide synthase